jgi:pimeloyl-ACP methyl ester carboxylesterase
MATFVICHGAWSAGWAWKKMRPLLRAAGHEVFTPSYTGLGERAHLASPMVDLETHIADVLGVIASEGLEDFILVGHSYGGMVATGVADRMAGKVRHLVYLDAFVPSDGQSLDDLRGGETMADVAGWLVSPMPPAPDTSASDLAWTGPRRMPQPGRTFGQKLRVTGAVEVVRRTYVYCAKKGAGDVFAQFSDRFKDDPRWGYVQIEASHSPNVTAPDELAKVLLGIAAL